jgi:hypothetical protein
MMDEQEYEAAHDAIDRLSPLPSVVARLSLNGAPDDLCNRAEAVLRLAVRVLDDVGVFTEIEALEGLIKAWSEE